MNTIILRLSLVLIGVTIGTTIWKFIQQRQLHRLQIQHTQLADQHANQRHLPDDIEPGRPTLLYFWSQNCVSCHNAQSPEIDRLYASMGDRLQLARVDCDLDLETAAHWHIFTLPTTIILDSRLQPVKINNGLTRASELQQQFHAIKASTAGYRPPAIEGTP